MENKIARNRKGKGRTTCFLHFLILEKAGIRTFLAYKILSLMTGSFQRYIVCKHRVRACQVTSVLADSATLWTIARQAPLSTRLFRQEYWSGLPCPSSGDLPNPGIKPASLVAYICRRVLDHLAPPEGKGLSAQTIGKMGTC